MAVMMGSGAVIEKWRMTGTRSGRCSGPWKSTVTLACPPSPSSRRGHGDTWEDAPGCLLNVDPISMEPCDDTQFGPAGMRGVPDIDQAAARLRWIAGNREEAHTMGQPASAWAHAERSIWAKAPAVIAVMERYALPPRPL